jgi:hypothetical protein
VRARPSITEARDLAALPLVEPGDGAEPLLSLVRADGSRVSVVLGTAEAVPLAAELLQAARVRMGLADWPPAIGTWRTYFRRGPLILLCNLSFLRLYQRLRPRLVSRLASLAGRCPDLDLARHQPAPAHGWPRAATLTGASRSVPALPATHLAAEGSSSVWPSNRKFETAISDELLRMTMSYIE